MTDILIVIKILFSFFLPIWIYYCITKTINKYSSSCLELKRDIPNVHFMLKRWWAENTINRKKKKKKQENDSHNYKKKHLTDFKIKDKDGANSVFFYGADQKGNSLLIKFSCRTLRIAEVSIQLTTSDGQLYVSPAYPDTTSAIGFNQEWTASGLKIEFLEFQHHWRIVYNGMLRNLCNGDEPSDDNVEHIRFNFIFIANSEPSRWPEDWSTKLHAEALACEAWKGPKWMNKIELLEYTGFDQWGSMIGQITYKDESVTAMYLRGLHQHRFGKHESYAFHESANLLGVMSYGAMYYLSMSSTRHSFPQMQVGLFRNNKEELCEIDKIGLKLSNFREEKFNTDSEYKTWFIAENKKYDISIKPKKTVTFYYGQPWNWLNKIVTVNLKMNGISGTGLIQLWSPYNGPCQAEPSRQLKFLKQPSVHVQRDDYVVHFDDSKCQNENIVGGKGISLAMLTSIKDADFVVPKGFCVTVFALELQLHTYKELQSAINDVENVCVGKKDGDLQKYCDEAMRIIESTPVVNEVKDAILLAVEKLELEDDGDKPFRYAIRSSAVGEDSDETSAAGQNSTYLGVRDKEDIIKSVAKCWASLFSYQSVKYRHQHGMFIKASMGVCIQKMVNADAAGVMFTRHPTNGDPSSIIITANYGLGESVVSAQVEPDTIIVHKSWNNKLSIKGSTVGNKKHKILSGDNGVDTIELDDQEKETVCLSEEMALRLAAIGVNLENLFGNARDIEWAVVNENIYLLQARPITSLYAWTDFELTHELDTGVPSDIDIISFANVGEVLPYPVAPLTLSISAKIIDLNCSAILKTIAHSFHNVGMRCGINYSNMMLLHPNKEIVLMNKALDFALCGKVIITPEINRIACEKNGEATSFTRMKIWWEMIKNAMKKNVTEIVKKNREKLTLNAEDFHNAYSLYNEINQQLEHYATVMGTHIFSSRVSISYQIFMLGLLTQGYKDLVPEHFSDIAVLLSSCSEVVGAEVVTSLKKIVNYIKKNEKDKEFKEIDPIKAINWLKVNCPMAASELDNFFKNHGHRCIQEMDFLSEPWSLKPENLITTLQMMVATTTETNDSKVLSAEETVALLKTPKSAVTKWILKKLVPHCRRAVVSREITKSTVVDVIHVFRLAYRRLGKLMVLEGYLPSEDLIFFLTNEEIGKMLNHRSTTYVQKALRRKRIFPRLREMKYSEVNIGMVLPLKNNLDTIVNEESPKIEGTPVCGGSTLSRACVITDVADAHQIQQGDILITHATDIAWSVYFPLLSGIVTEMGGLISHGAVIAREYGLPCIIGARNATDVFHTGDTVLLAADVGTLQLVKKHD
ncbi:rifampicin phosphotransferase-like [Xylocopa sonorina]|uniref:rifampicin phosphotransferase-like n=1 Tax=Xylocopa sonorina TaxID=1818115 RepID=UPI00403AB868